jgi:transcriptional regulator with XRE-family HTH domain
MTALRDVERLGRAVYTRRRQLGLSQQELAEAAGVSQTTIRNIEAGRVGARRGPSVPLVERALGWKAGSGEDVLAGGEPTVLAEEPAPAGYVSSRRRNLVVLEDVPLEELRAELDRRIEALVREAAAANPEAP